MFFRFYAGPRALDVLASRAIELPLLSLWAIDGWLTTPFALAATGCLGAAFVAANPRTRKVVLGAGLATAISGVALTLFGLYAPLLQQTP